MPLQMTMAREREEYSKSLHEKIEFTEKLINAFLSEADIATPSLYYGNQDNDLYGLIVIEAHGTDRNLRGYRFYPGISRDEAAKIAARLPEAEGQNIKDYANLVRDFLARLD